MKKKQYFLVHEMLLDIVGSGQPPDNPPDNPLDNPPDNPPHRTTTLGCYLQRFAALKEIRKAI